METGLQVVGLSKVYDPGAHCAFTDLHVWRGRVWLACREAVNHGVHPSSQIVVLSSADHGRNFSVMSRIAARGLDVRDPHFYVVDDRLHLTIPCWTQPPCDTKTGKRITILARSDDGLSWEQHREIAGFEGQTIWRPRKHPSDGHWYVAAYDRDYDRDTGRVALMRTLDGLKWQTVSVIETDEFPNETDLCFLADGTLLALVRREKADGIPLLARAQAPYTTWSKTLGDRWFRGPLLEHLGAGRFMAVGRVYKDDTSKAYVTRIHALDAETGKMRPETTLESGHDTSYAAFVRLPEGSESGAFGAGNALLSYYSGHEYPHGAYRNGEQSQRCAIYVARVKV